MNNNTHAMTESPPRDEQEAFWDEWNSGNRLGEVDPYMERLRAEALKWARTLPPGKRLLEVGCGTGWLAGSLTSCGEVVGVDLSPAAIAFAQSKYPAAKFLQGDFATMAIPKPVDFVVTADSIAHVPDHKAFVDRVADLLAPGGMFLLMTQNRFVWKRSTYVQPKGAAQIRNWPSIAEIRSLMAGRFEIVRVASLVPGGGNVGIMRVLNSRYVWGVLRHTIGLRRVTALYERLCLGKELVVLARRI